MTTAIRLFLLFTETAVDRTHMACPVGIRRRSLHGVLLHTVSLSACVCLRNQTNTVANGFFMEQCSLFKWLDSEIMNLLNVDDTWKHGS